MGIHIKINTRQKSVLISALRNPLEIIIGLSHKLLIQNMRNHALVCNLHKIIQKNNTFATMPVPAFLAFRNCTF